MLAGKCQEFQQQCSERGASGQHTDSHRRIDSSVEFGLAVHGNLFGAICVGAVSRSKRVRLKNVMNIHGN